MWVARVTLDAQSLYSFVFLSFKTDFKTSPKIVGIPNRSWTPCCKDSLQSSLDYQRNVYIPGTPSTHCTLKVANNGDLEVYNSFSTFGKKKKLMPNNNCQEDAIMTNDFFKWIFHLHFSPVFNWHIVCLRSVCCC